MKKRSFSLVEILCAMVLGVFMITALMQLLHFSQKTEEKSSGICSNTLELARAQEELGESIALATALREGDKGFFKENNLASGVVFSLDNGIDPDPNFCGLVCGRLWVDGENLMLSLYNKERSRDNILVKGAQKVSWALWDGEKWQQEHFMPVCDQTRALKVELISQGKKEELAIHLIYAHPIEVKCTTTQPL